MFEKKPQDVVKYLSYQKGFPGGSDSEESTSNAGDWDSVPESGRFPWGREWLPTPVFCLENSMDSGAWQTMVCGVTKRWT